MNRPMTADEALRLEMQGALYRIITRARRAGWKLCTGTVHVRKQRSGGYHRTRKGKG